MCDFCERMKARVGDVGQRYEVSCLGFDYEDPQPTSGLSGGIGEMSEKPRKIPKELSRGEEAFALHCRAEKIYPIREWRFHPERKYRFDFAFLHEKIAVEIEGGVFVFGGHSRGKGFEKDCEKYNLAVKLGWRILRYSTDQVIAGTAINDMLELLNANAVKPKGEK